MSNNDDRFFIIRVQLNAVLYCLAYWLIDNIFYLNISELKCNNAARRGQLTIVEKELALQESSINVRWPNSIFTSISENVNGPTNEGSALSFAIANAHVDIVKKLIESGADIDLELI